MTLQTPASEQTNVVSASGPRIVIVGAGFGGLAAARALRRTNASITIVDQQNHHVFQPLLYQVATAGLSPADIAAPIRSIVARQRHTQVRLGRATGIDTADRVVLLDDGDSVPFDYLVLATGARHSYFGKEAWSECAPGIKTLDDATRVRRNVLLALERAEVERDPDELERLVTFVLVGGGPTGVEMAGAIAELTRVSVGMDFRAFMPDRARIVLIEAGSRLLSTFPEALSTKAKTALERLGVEVLLNARVEHIDALGVQVPGRTIAAATVVWTAGVMASPAARWLGVEADRAGRIVVNSDMSVPGHDAIFAIGDTAAVRTADGSVVPGVAPAAKQAGRHVGDVIAARIAGRATPAPFRYRDYGNLATIGRKRAIADFGWLRVSGLWAWLIWSTAHIFFLVGFRNRIAVGATWLWSYATFNRGARLITGISYPDAPIRDQPMGPPA